MKLSSPLRAIALLVALSAAPAAPQSGGNAYAIGGIDVDVAAPNADAARMAGFRIARVDQDLRALPAGHREAAALAIPRRAPVLRIVRAYRDENGRLVIVSVSTHPGERFTYSMHIDQ